MPSTNAAAALNESLQAPQTPNTGTNASRSAWGSSFMELLGDNALLRSLGLSAKLDDGTPIDVNTVKTGSAVQAKNHLGGTVECVVGQKILYQAAGEDQRRPWYVIGLTKTRPPMMILGNSLKGEGGFRFKVSPAMLDRMASEECTYTNNRISTIENKIGYLQSVFQEDLSKNVVKTIRGKSLGNTPYDTMPFFILGWPISARDITQYGLGAACANLEVTSMQILAELEALKFSVQNSKLLKHETEALEKSIEGAEKVLEASLKRLPSYEEMNTPDMVRMRQDFISLASEESRKAAKDTEGQSISDIMTHFGEKFASAELRDLGTIVTLMQLGNPKLVTSQHTARAREVLYSLSMKRAQILTFIDTLFLELSHSETWESLQGMTPELRAEVIASMRQKAIYSSTHGLENDGYPIPPAILYVYEGLDTLLTEFNRLDTTLTAYESGSIPKPRAKSANINSPIANDLAPSSATLSRIGWALALLAGLWLGMAAFDASAASTGTSSIQHVYDVLSPLEHNLWRDIGKGGFYVDIKGSNFEISIPKDDTGQYINIRVPVGTSDREILEKVTLKIHDKTGMRAPLTPAAVQRITTEKPKKSEHPVRHSGVFHMSEPGGDPFAPFAKTTASGAPDGVAVRFEHPDTPHAVPKHQIIAPDGRPVFDGDVRNPDLYQDKQDTDRQGMNIRDRDRKDPTRQRVSPNGKNQIPDVRHTIDLGNLGSLNAHAWSGSSLDQALNVRAEAGIDYITPDRLLKIGVTGQQLELAAGKLQKAVKLTLARIIRGADSEGAVYFSYDKTLGQGVEKLLGGAVVTINGKTQIRVEVEKLRQLQSVVTSMGAKDFMGDMSAAGIDVQHHFSGVVQTVGILFALAHTPTKSLVIGGRTVQTDEALETYTRQAFLPGSDHYIFEPNITLRLNQYIKFVAGAGAEYIHYARDLGRDMAGLAVVGNTPDKLRATGHVQVTWQPEGDAGRYSLGGRMTDGKFAVTASAGYYVAPWVRTELGVEHEVMGGHGTSVLSRVVFETGPHKHEGYSALFGKNDGKFAPLNIEDVEKSHLGDIMGTFKPEYGNPIERESLTNVTDNVAPKISISSCTAGNNNVDCVLSLSNETKPVTVYYKVVARGTAMTAASLISTGLSTTMTKGVDKTVSVASLSSGTDYTMFEVAKDQAGNISAVQKKDFTTTSPGPGPGPGPTPAPTVTAATASGITTTGVTCNFNVDKAGDTWCVAVPTGTVPGVAAIKAGTKVTKASASAVAAAIAGLTASTVYDLWTVANNGTDSAPVKGATFTTAAPAATAPTLSGVSCNAATATGCTLNITTNKASDLYGLAVPTGSPQPTDAAIKAGTHLVAGAAGAFSGAIAGLANETTYDIWTIGTTGGVDSVAAKAAGTITTLGTAATTTSLTNSATDAVKTTVNVAIDKGATINVYISTNAAETAATILASGTTIDGTAGAGTYHTTISGLSWGVTYYTHTYTVHSGVASGVTNSVAFTTLNAASGIASEDLSNLNTAGGGGTGNVTFDQKIDSVTSVQFFDSGTGLSLGADGSASATVNGGNNKRIDITFSAPVGATSDVYFVYTLVSNGKTVTITDTNTYTLF